jgi:8-oxo-dGTP pyrophosphatase MutT (NUDIX family)
MVAHDVNSLVHTLSRAVILLSQDRNRRRYTCPYCHLSGLTEFEMWNHIPVYHVNWPASSHVQETCPICDQHYRCPLQVHIHARHGPNSYDRSRPENKVSMTQLYCFALVVCRHPVTGLFLLCQEFANQGFWLPGGAVDNNEPITDAAKRETMEEAGIAVELKGILSIEYNPTGLYDTQPALDTYLVRMRVIFYAEPTIEQMNTMPKSSPDFESVGACWCSAEEILLQDPVSLKLRGNEPRQWVTYIQNGGSIYPLTILREKVG